MRGPTTVDGATTVVSSDGAGAGTCSRGNNHGATATAVAMQANCNTFIPLPPEPCERYPHKRITRRFAACRRDHNAARSRRYYGLTGVNMVTVEAGTARSVVIFGRAAMGKRLKTRWFFGFCLLAGAFGMAGTVR